MGDISGDQVNKEPSLAFEHFDENGTKQTLWRVSYLRRSSHGGSVWCVDYFTDKDMAWNFASRRISAGCVDVRVVKFNLIKDDP